MLTDPNCIFCKIVAGEIPANKVYEDEQFLAFLDVNPVQFGHTLLIPKDHQPSIFKINDNDYAALWLKAKTLAPAIQRATNAKRIGIFVEGFAVPHTHIHLVPINNGFELDPNSKKLITPEALAEMAEKVRAEML
jgi:histidine triad (HIT) family protein